jgi:hypothetical protein
MPSTTGAPSLLNHFQDNKNITYPEATPLPLTLPPMLQMEPNHIVSSDI